MQNPDPYRHDDPLDVYGPALTPQLLQLLQAAAVQRQLRPLLKPHLDAKAKAARRARARQASKDRARNR
jgi:hypothetical protein